MSFSKARLPLNFAAQFKAQQKNIQILYARDRISRSPGFQTPILPQAGASPPSSSPSFAYLKTQGDTMVGPLALGNTFTSGNNANVITIDGSGKRHFSVAQNSGYYSSNGYILPPGGGSSSTLDYIDGAKFNGQIFKAHILATDTITINSAIGPTGNIYTPQSVPMLFNGPCVIEFIFDENLGSSGGWMLANNSPNTTVSSTVYPVKVVSGGYAVQPSDVVLVYESSSFAFTVTLPFSFNNPGKLYYFINDGTGPGLNIDAQIGDFINNGTEVQLNARYNKVILLSDGQRWIAMD